MSKKELVFVINPKAGIEREKSVQKNIDQFIDHTLYQVTIEHTTKPKHGIEIAMEAAENKKHAVIAIGGDGSVNDIVKGLVNTDTALGIIPKGSGNGVARTLKIPLDERKAMQLINNGHISTMDVGMANNHLFASNIGVGFDAAIAKTFGKNRTRGIVGYIAEVIKNLFYYKEKTWTINIDGKEIKHEAFMVVIANCREFGYNFQIAPMAKWDDGLLEIVVVKKFPILMGTTIIYRAITGKITENRYVEHFTGKTISIYADNIDAMQTDGDYYPIADKQQLHIKLMNNCLKVIC